MMIGMEALCMSCKVFLVKLRKKRGKVWNKMLQALSNNYTLKKERRNHKVNNQAAASTNRFRKDPMMINLHKLQGLPPLPLICICKMQSLCRHRHGNPAEFVVCAKLPRELSYHIMDCNKDFNPGKLVSWTYSRSSSKCNEAVRRN
ncbi:uncharacterized protein [Malus domestica]|uniref:uncharacterized protein isoform X2 n=1 Tax=Malus domestica TaxID=3750 RepID=UPI003975D1AA